MSQVDLMMLFLLLMPLVAFYLVFKKNWVDEELKKAATWGLVSGVFCITLTRIVYYPVEWFLGGDLRSFITAPREWWITLLASVCIIGLIEEAIKASGGIMVAHLARFNKRPTIVFMAFSGCALSFSLLENIQYYAIFGSHVVLPRMVISSTAHLYFSCMCAAIAANAINRPRSDSTVALRILLAIIAAAVFHGLFDFVVFKLNLQMLSGVIIAFVSLFILGIHEAWISVLKIDNQPREGLMICSGCGAFSIGRARFCNFCGSRIVLSRRDFTIKLAD
ncbi:MAG: PrsW family glutamic-type intramembrane protease [Candidatus Riflebacteria bacterium]